MILEQWEMSWRCVVCTAFKVCLFSWILISTSVKPQPAATRTRNLIHLRLLTLQNNLPLHSHYTTACLFISSRLYYLAAIKWWKPKNHLHLTFVICVHVRFVSQSHFTCGQFWNWLCNKTLKQGPGLHLRIPLKDECVQVDICPANKKAVAVVLSHAWPHAKFMWSAEALRRESSDYSATAEFCILRAM